MEVSLNGKTYRVYKENRTVFVRVTRNCRTYWMRLVGHGPVVTELLAL